MKISAVPGGVEQDVQHCSQKRRYLCILAPVDSEDFAQTLFQIFSSDDPLHFEDLSIYYGRIPHFSIKELITAVKPLNTLRCEDTQGVVSEMIKYGSTNLHICILQCFNSILVGTPVDPS